MQILKNKRSKPANDKKHNNNGGGNQSSYQNNGYYNGWIEAMLLLLQVSMYVY